MNMRAFDVMRLWLGLISSTFFGALWGIVAEALFPISAAFHVFVGDVIFGPSHIYSFLRSDP